MAQGSLTAAGTAFGKPKPGDDLWTRVIVAGALLVIAIKAIARRYRISSRLVAVASCTALGILFSLVACKKHQEYQSLQSAPLFIGARTISLRATLATPLSVTKLPNNKFRVETTQEALEFPNANVYAGQALQFRIRDDNHLVVTIPETDASARIVQKLPANMTWELPAQYNEEVCKPQNASSMAAVIAVLALALASLCQLRCFVDETE